MRLKMKVNHWVLSTMSVFSMLGVAEMDYGYYTFLKIAIFLMAMYIVFENHKTKTYKISPWIWIAVAIIYNPIKEIEIEKDTWAIVNCGMSLLFGYAAYNQYRNNSVDLDYSKYQDELHTFLQIRTDYTELLESQIADPDFGVQIMIFESLAYERNLSANSAATLISEAYKKYRTSPEHALTFITSLIEKMEAKN